jgi:hypothetical protein
MKRIYADVDEALYRAFSIRLAEEGRKMAPVVRELVERWVEEGTK